MKVGTKSLLFGVHNIVWHGITVTLAWHHLYREWPTWKEFVCIVFHDVGLWGSPNMDGKEGEMHPVRSAQFILKYFLNRWYPAAHFHERIEMYNLVMFHSRHFAKAVNAEPSKLCWADKYSIAYDPAWFYLLRAHLSGEIKEYREMSAKNCWGISLDESDWVWFQRGRNQMMKLGESMNPTEIGYRHEPKVD